MVLRCRECNEKVECCDECGMQFSEGDEVLCHSFDHIHENCLDLSEIYEGDDW